MKEQSSEHALLVKYSARAIVLCAMAWHTTLPVCSRWVTCVMKDNEPDQYTARSSVSYRGGLVTWWVIGYHQRHSLKLPDHYVMAAS